MKVFAGWAEVGDLAEEAASCWTDATHSLSTLSSDIRLQCSFRLCSSFCFCCSESLGKKSFCPLTGIL